ncbi:MAG: TnpV protein [Oscillibacter sp.]|nr:TnpV protein [Oscillibacter sp.]
MAKGMARRENEAVRLAPDRAGATEELKAHAQMAWIGPVNNCKARIEEIIYADLIYTQNCLECMVSPVANSHGGYFFAQQQ